MELKNILSLCTSVLFLGLLLFGNNVRRTYIISVILLIPLTDLLITPPSAGGLSVFEWMSVSSFLLYVPKLRVHSSRYLPTLFFFVVLSFFLLLGCLTSDFVFKSLMGYIKYLCVFFYGKMLIDECSENHGFFVKVLDLLRISCLVSVLFLCLQMYFGLEFSFYDDLNVNTQVETGVRYPSFFSDPQKYAQFLAMLSFLFLIKTSNFRLYNKSHYVFFVVTIFALLITGGRAGFMGLVVAYSVVIFLGSSKFRVFGLFCFALGAIGVYIFSEHLMVFNREQTVDDSFDFRYMIWQGAFDIFQQQPLLGIGLENYQDYVSQFRQDHYWELNDDFMYMDHPESGYLKWLTEYGFIGFLIVILLILHPVFSTIKIYFRRQQNFDQLLIAASVISFLISFFTVYSLSDKRVLIVLITLIALLAFLNEEKKLLYVSKH